MLDCLGQHGIRSTFFVLGRKVSTPAGLELARRASREGHWIGNHTWSHVGRLGEGTREVALEEFERTEQALSWIDKSVQTVPLFRPRGGAGKLGRGLLHPAVVERLTLGEYTCVLWNSVPATIGSGRLDGSCAGRLPNARMEFSGPARSSQWRDATS